VLIRRGLLLLVVLLGFQVSLVSAETTVSAPTVRLWATREGLVGRTTASGHLIEPNDHFVALPSRRAVGQVVVVSYKGKKVTAPVLDVGPWNRNDAWWEAGATRGQFPDLPRFVPEVWAAWDSGYNGGHDGTGRWVAFPAMIDLADGVFGDLGMTRSDWVDVTLTWINAPSPPPLASPDRPITHKIDPSLPALKHDERYYPDTGFRVDQDAIWSYFQARGGLAVFGLPVSRTFLLFGCQVQIFQRQIAQLCDGRGPALMNMLDPDLFPYDHINGSSLPAPDTVIKAQTPGVSSPEYAGAIVDFVLKNAPDVFEGQSVNFGRTFFSAGGPDTPLIGLEMWGAPISHPWRDPNNANFVYQRFQRGIMHFDATTGRTQGLLLADYVKSILRDREIPADLARAAAGNRLFDQYCPGAAHWVCRPAQLPGTDLTYAFEHG
jgi:hypothetical protein